MSDTDVKALPSTIIRFLDIILAGSALTILAPILLIVMAILRFTGENQVFYRQTRIGKGEKEFPLLKFATMLQNSPAIGSGELTLPNDPRVLPVGRILRKTKINELPQLWNVLTGDMSVIGPRPQTRKYYNFYASEDRHYIAQVRPGLSGVGSVLFRDEEKLLESVEDPITFDNELITPYKGQVEKWFVSNYSVTLYFRLILTTMISVLSPDSKSPEWLRKEIPTPPSQLAELI